MRVWCCALTLLISIVEGAPSWDVDKSVWVQVGYHSEYQRE